MSNVSCRYCGSSFNPADSPEMCREAPVSVLYHTALVRISNPGIRLFQTNSEAPPDDRDAEIVAARMAKLDEITGTPRVGDWVDFDNGKGVRQRVSHIWHNGVQTSAGGSYYLGDGYVSMSGSLDGIEPFETLTLTDAIRTATVWIFHHDWHKAHNAVGAEVPFRVWQCSSEWPR